MNLHILTFAPKHLLHRPPLLVLHSFPTDMVSDCSERWPIGGQCGQLVNWVQICSIGQRLETAVWPWAQKCFQPLCRSSKYFDFSPRCGFPEYSSDYTWVLSTGTPLYEQREINRVKNQNLKLHWQGFHCKRLFNCPAEDTSLHSSTCFHIWMEHLVSFPDWLPKVDLSIVEKVYGTLFPRI